MAIGAIENARVQDHFESGSMFKPKSRASNTSYSFLRFKSFVSNGFYPRVGLENQAVLPGPTSILQVNLEVYLLGFSTSNSDFPSGPPEVGHFFQSFIQLLPGAFLDATAERPHVGRRGMKELLQRVGSAFFWSMRFSEPVVITSYNSEKRYSCREVRSNSTSYPMFSTLFWQYYWNNPPPKKGSTLR